MTTQTESIDPPVSTKVVQQVAAVTGQEVAQLQPLYDTIDPEALDAIMNSGAADTPSPIIQFTYSGYRITVDESGEVSVDK